MVQLPTEIIQEILSYHPVKDPKYDICMDQLKYLSNIYNIGKGVIYCNPHFYYFVLRKNREKMSLYNRIKSV